MASQSEGLLPAPVVVDVNEDNARASLDSILQQVIDFMKTRYMAVAAVLKAAVFMLFVLVLVVFLVAGAFFIFTSLMPHGGHNGTVPYEPTTELNDTTSIYLNHSTTYHPRLPAADLESFRRQNQSLLALGCQPTPRKAKVAALLRPKDRILDQDLYPKEITIETCDDAYSYCGVGSVCVPARSNTGQKVVKPWYFEGERVVTVTRTFPSDSVCECQ